MFSKACEYAIRATLLVASHSLMDERVSVKDIAEATASPVAFTAKIMQQLNRCGILYSVQGKQGGFEMTKEQMQATKLSQIVTLIDGDRVFTGCGLGLRECNALKPCPLHERFSSVRGELKAMLDETTVLDLALGLKDGLTFLRT
ncbi:MAG: Rrf2 family transcriptional regulator [Saprospiraceae bacterium]|nr:Rrf2 family transcriptional regulator [Saprospiraceae bacterium]